MKEVGTRLLRALIVEDEWAARNYLIELVNGSGAAQVLGAVATVEEAQEALRATPPGVSIEVLFIDIHLAGHFREDAGLELARAVCALPNGPMCVLATASERHALQAFEVGIVDYLVKPFSQERVNQCLSRLRALRPAQGEASATPLRIVARSRKQLVLLKPDEVWAFEAADRLSFVHTTYGRFDIDLSLTALEGSFGPSWIRVHRNWLVNKDYVRGIERDEGDQTLVLGIGIGDKHPVIRVPVARDRAHIVREKLLSDATGVRKA